VLFLYVLVVIVPTTILLLLLLFIVYRTLRRKKRQPFHSLFEWLYFVPHILLLLLLRAVLVFLCIVFIAPDITLLDARI